MFSYLPGSTIYIWLFLHKASIISQLNPRHGSYGGEDKEGNEVEWNRTGREREMCVQGEESDILLKYIVKAQESYRRRNLEAIEVGDEE